MYSTQHPVHCTLHLQTQKYSVLVLSKGGFSDQTVEDAKDLLARVLRYSLLYRFLQIIRNFPVFLHSFSLFDLCPGVGGKAQEVCLPF